MPTGIQIINQTTGSVQIDENYKNLAFRQKGSVTITSTSMTLSWTGTNPILALRPTSSTLVGCPALSQSGSTFTWTIRTGASSGSFDYYIFDNVPSGGSGLNAGLQVFNGSSELTFDAGMKYMKVIDYWFVPGSDSTTLSKSYDASKTYAGAIALQGGGFVPVGDNTTLVLTQGIRWSGATVTRGTIQVGNGALGQISYRWPFAVLVLDVTGY